MVKPVTAEVLRKAIELYHISESRANPTVAELLKGGFVSQAEKTLSKPEYVLPVSSTIPFDVKECLESGFCCFGTSGSGKTSLAKKLVQRLQLEGAIVLVVDPSQSWTKPDSPILNHLTLRSPVSTFTYGLQDTVFDLSRVNIAERFKFVDALCKTIMDFRVDQIDIESQPWIVVVFEEAQLFLPNGCLRSLEKYGNILDLLTVGRNFKIRFGLISQFASSVDKAPVKLSAQRYFGLTGEQNDINYIKSFLGKQTVEQVKQLSKLEFIYQNKNTVDRFKFEHTQNKPSFQVNGQAVQTAAEQGKQYSYDVSYCV